MRTWFTSDQHWDHYNIIKYCNRPFQGLRDMQEVMVSNHNLLVSDEDVVYHLGDFCFEPANIKPILSCLKGKHILVAGNHDRCFKDAGATPLYKGAGFFDVIQGGVYLDDLRLYLSHMPATSGNGLEFDSARKHLNGHVHGDWKMRPGMLNVGVDVWDFKPVSLEEVYNSFV